MKWLGRLLASVLTVALAVTAIIWVLNATVWNSDYVLKTAGDNGLYDGIAKALPPVLEGPNVTGDQHYVLAQIVTPGLVRHHLEGAISGLQRYYRDGGEPPRLDFSDVKQQFDTLGLKPPPMVAALINKPVTLSNPAVDSLATAASHQTSQLLWLGPVVAAALVALIVLVTGRRRWNVLAGAAFGAAILTIIASGLVLVVPALATTSLSTSVWSVLAPSIKAFGQVIAHDVSQRLMWCAVGLATAAVLLGISGLAASALHKLPRRRDKAVPTE